MDQKEFWLFSDCLRIDGRDGSFIKTVPAPEEQRHFDGIVLHAARNAHACFQLAAAPASGKISGLELLWSPLTGPAGEISAENVRFYTQWFHRLHGKLVPDLLLPFNGPLAFAVPLDRERLADQRAGAIWVELWVPPEQPAGDYAGTLTVRSGGQEQVFCISCRVSACTVPVRNKITADFNNYADSLSDSFDSLRDNPERYRDGSYLAVEQGFYRMSREHKGVYHNLPYRHSGAMPESFAPELEGEGKDIRVKSWEAFDAHFGPYFDGSAFADCRGGTYPVEFAYLPFSLAWPANYEKWGKKGYRTGYRRILGEFVRHFEEKGWDATVFEILLNNKKDYWFFPYTIDEIWYEHDQDVVDTYYDIIRGTFEDSRAKFVSRMDSSNHCGNHLDHRFSDYCGMWVAGDAMFSWFPESVEVMRRKGNILWIYGSVLQALDEPLLSLWVWPVRCMMTGATGFTVWNTTGFGTDPLTCPAASGGQALFYPGSPFGLEQPLPSIRLKSLRSAMEVVELAMTQEAGPLQAELERRLNGALGMAGKEAWFRPKPEFVKTPPRYWDFDEAVPEAALPPVYLGRDPLLPEELRKQVYECLESGICRGDGANFRFQ